MGGADWTTIRADTQAGMTRFWPVLLAAALVGTAVYVVNGVLLDEVRSQAQGLPGYLNYLSLTAADVLPAAILFAVQAGLVLNGLSVQPIGWAAILRRSPRALPAVLVAMAIINAPYLLSTLITYADVDFATWWIAYAAGSVASVGLVTIWGFTGLEAIARGLGPWAALRASAALTHGQRGWLAGLFLAVELVSELLRQVSYPLNALLLDRGVTALGQTPVTHALFWLMGTVILPLQVAVYLELRRRGAEDIPGVGSTFD